MKFFMPGIYLSEKKARGDEKSSSVYFPPPPSLFTALFVPLDLNFCLCWETFWCEEEKWKVKEGEPPFKHNLFVTTSKTVKSNYLVKGNICYCSRAVICSAVASMLCLFKSVKRERGIIVLGSGTWWASPIRFCLSPVGTGIPGMAGTSASHLMGFGVTETGLDIHPSSCFISGFLQINIFFDLQGLGHIHETKDILGCLWNLKELSNEF